MNNQQHSTQSRSNGMPPPFAFNNAVLAENYKRIVENKGGRFEREAIVPSLVDPVLFRPTQTASLYKMYNMSRGVPPQPFYHARAVPSKTSRPPNSSATPGVPARCPTT